MISIHIPHRSSASVALLCPLCVGLSLYLNVESALGQVRTAQYSVSTMADNTVTYTLPSTCFYAVFEVEETLREPGEFALYAARHLGTKEVLLEPVRTFELKGVALGSYGVPEDSLRFSTEFGRRNTATNVTLSNDGRLLAINADQVTLPEIPETQRADLRMGEGFAPLTGLPLEYVQATSLAKKAEIVADEIYRIREGRNAVVSGRSEQPFPDGEAMKVAIEGLDEAEKALTERFLGVTRTVTHKIVVKGIAPKEEDQVVARFSKKLGLLPAEDLRGEPLYFKAKVTEEAPPLDERDQKRKARQLSRGVVYILPSRMNVEIRDIRDKVWIEGSYPTAQHGTLEALDEALFTERDKVTEIHFDATTGAILKIQAHQQ